MRGLKIAVFLLLVEVGLAFGQTGITLVGAGYSDPTTILRVAPGQVTTFFLAGVKTILPPAVPPAATVRRATEFPLPTELAGFSATVSQKQQNPEPLPIFSAEQVNYCSEGAAPSPDCLITALTVQIPFDLDSDFGRYSPFTTITTVAVAEGGTVSKRFNVIPLPRNIHILTTCDAPMVNRSDASFTSGCASVVTHLDGSLVTFQNPAKVGETPVMYGYGLGPTVPTVRAGDRTPVPAPIASAKFSLSFSYGVALTTQENPSLSPNPSFAGLAPGQVGLYQVNFVVPAPASPLPSCTDPDEANVTIALSSDWSPSMDLARICVDPLSGAGRGTPLNQPGGYR